MNKQKKSIKQILSTVWFGFCTGFTIFCFILAFLQCCGFLSACSSPTGEKHVVAQAAETIQPRVTSSKVYVQNENGFKQQVDQYELTPILNGLFEYRYAWMDMNASGYTMKSIKVEGTDIDEYIAYTNDGGVVIVHDTLTEDTLLSSLGEDNTWVLITYLGDYRMGESDRGYDEGYVDGLAVSQYGIFADAFIENRLTWSNGSYTLSESIARQFAMDNALDFARLYTAITFNPPVERATVTKAVFSIRLAVPILYYPDTFPLIFDGSRYNIQVALISTSGTYYDAVWSPLNVYPSALVFPDTAVGKSISCIQFIFLDPPSTLTSTAVFMTGNSGYYGGYNAGRLDGERSGYERGLAEGYDDGYTAGKEAGKDEGYLLGLETAGTGSFFSLFSSLIDAPVSVFSSLLDFDVLGFNMRSFVLSLLSVALVVAAIRLFSKGGG